MSSSTLPDFESHDPYPFKLLPDGVHRTDEPSFRQRFVEDFHDSQTRTALCDGFFLLRAEALRHHLSATQWIDGSFVEGKFNPGDVDLVSFIDYDSLNALGVESRIFVANCLNGQEATKAKYQSHTFLVPACPSNHPYFHAFETYRVYWRKWFGKTREEPIPGGPNYPSIPKGIVEMTLGDSQLAPQIAKERGTS